MRATLIATLLLLSSAYGIQSVRAGASDTGIPVGWRILTPSYDPIRIAICARISSAAQGIGLDVSCELQGLVPLMVYLFVYQDFQAYIGGWSFGVIPGYLYDFFNSQNIVPEGNNNIHANRTALDTLTNNYRFQCGTSAACASLPQQIESYVFSNGLYFPMYNRASDGAVNNQSYAGYYNQPGYGFIFNPFWSLMNVHVAGSTTVGIDNATKGRPFTFAFRDPIGGVNVFSVADNSVFWPDVYQPIFDTLYRINPVTLTPSIPWLGTAVKSACTSATPNGGSCGAAGTKDSWTLNTNTTWSDGYAFNASDVDFTIALLRGQIGAGCFPFPYCSLNNITDHVITGSNTIDVYYNASGFFLDYDALAGWPVLPAHLFAAVGGGPTYPDAAAYLADPFNYEPANLTMRKAFLVGTGAYKWDSDNLANGTITLVRRPSYNVSDPTSYWRPDPSPSDAFDCIPTNCHGSTPASTLPPLYHGGWVQHIQYVTIGADQSNQLITNSIDQTGWNIPSAQEGNINANLLALGHGHFTHPANFGMFYMATNLGEDNPTVQLTDPWGGNPNPFSDNFGTASVRTNIGGLFRQSINHLIPRSTIAATDCGFGCITLPSMVPSVYVIGGNSFHNSSIDSDPLLTYDPTEMNATLNIMASKNLAIFNSVTGNWDYAQLVVPALPNGILFLIALGLTTPLVYRRIKARLR